jgi:hypothetical protein
MKNMKNVFFCLIAAISLLGAKKSIGAVDPDIQWESINTPHFEVIYDARHYQTARKYALRLELNHKLLGTYFSESPMKTIVILNDNTDLANGYATRIPYPHIMAYPVLPASHDSISYYSDWPQELTIHEYAHILNFEPASGVIKILRNIMGSVITPTMLLPRWWHEGVAVEMETRFSTHGRLRSIYQDATLRAIASENLFSQYSIADINETEIDSWPRGARPYLFGSIVMSEMFAQNSSNVGDILLQRYGGRIPYLLNGPAEEVTGKDFNTWFNEAVASVGSKAQEQLTLLRQFKVTQFVPLAKKFLDSHSPQISPNGRFLTFVAKNTWGKNSIQILDRHEDGRPFQLDDDSFSEFLSIDNKQNASGSDAPPAGNINRVAWLPDSTGFIFDQVRFVNSYANYSDLFYFDLNNKKNKRLTTGMRLREPALSPNGQAIVAVQLEQSDTRLATLNNDGTNLAIVYKPPSFFKISHPIFLDDQTLIFTERDLRGVNTIKTFNLTTKQVGTITTPSIEQVDSLNRELNGISFVAQENGIQNFYITKDQFKTFQRLTHAETAVFDGSIDHRMGVLFNTIMTGSGLQVTSSALDSAKDSEKFQAPPPKVEALMASRYDNKNLTLPNDQALESEFGPSLGEKVSYSSFKHLAPRYWLPFVYFTESGVGTQISTTTFDPLEKHAYTAQAGYDSFAQESSLALNYSNATTRWPFNVGASIQHRNQPLLKSEFEAKQLNIMTTHDLRPYSEDITVGLGVDTNEITTSKTLKRSGPQLAFIYDGTAKSNFVSIPFAGFQLGAFGNYYVKTESLSSMSKAVIKATYFHSKYLPERHIALLHLIGQEMKGELGEADLTQSEHYHLNQNLSTPNFVLRGYDQGYFYFKSARGATFEYHIPISGFQGWGTMPLFAKHTRLNFYAEALAVNGIALNLGTMQYERAYLKRFYSSYGFELKADLSLGYYFPLTYILGIYQRPEYSGPGKTTAFIGFQI